MKKRNYNVIINDKVETPYGMGEVHTVETNRTETIFWVDPLNENEEWGRYCFIENELKKC